MITKFRCSKCGHEFSVKNSGMKEISCPKCGSKDVIPLSSSSNAPIKIIAIILGLVAVGCVAFLLVNNVINQDKEPSGNPGGGPVVIDTPNGPEVEDYKITSIKPDTVKPNQEITISGVGVEKAMEVVFSSNEGHNATISKGGIKVKDGAITLSVPPTAISGSVTLKFEDGKSATSPTDIVVAVPVVTDVKTVNGATGGKVTVTGQNLDLVAKIFLPNGQPASFDYNDAKGVLNVNVPAATSVGDVTGETLSGIKLTILKVIQAAAPLATQAEVQSWMSQLGNGSSNNPLLSSKHPKVAPGATYILTNRQDGEVVPTNAAGIQEKITFGDWSGVTVVKVEYDTLGRVSSITYSAKHNN